MHLHHIFASSKGLQRPSQVWGKPSLTGSPSAVLHQGVKSRLTARDSKSSLTAGSPSQVSYQGVKVNSHSRESKWSLTVGSPSEARELSHISQQASPAKQSHKSCFLITRVQSLQLWSRQDKIITGESACLSICVGTHAAHPKSHALTKDLSLSVNSQRH